MKSRAELFAERIIRRKVERQAKEWVRAFCSGLSVEDLRYAAENNLSIINPLLKPGEQKSRRRKAVPFRHLIEAVSTDNVIRLFDEVSPEHAAVLRQHRQWLVAQLEAAKRDVLG